MHGRAETTLILEDDASGVYRISAWRSDDGTLTAIFVVTVDAAPSPRSTITITTTTPLREPTTLSIISGDNQEGIAGTVLADPFVVEVRDQDGEPLSRVTVTFTVTAGRGAMGVVTSRTDSDGRVASVMTLSPEPGLNRVWVSVEDLSQIVIFNAEGIAPPPEPMSDEEEETIPPITEPMPDGEEEVIPPIAEPMPSLTFDLALPSGLNLIHIPLKVRAVNGMPAGIESVSDLYDALGGVATVNWIITHDSVTQEWHGYFGEADRGAIADRALTEGSGILASTKMPISIRLAGDALGTNGTSTIILNPGLNLVGLPLNDPRITRVSDLLGLKGLVGASL